MFTRLATFLFVASVAAAQTISTYAGGGTNSSDGIAATGALLQIAGGLAFDRAGNLYIWETGPAKIRKVSPSGTITTFAGNGTSGFSGDGGPATSASLFAGSAVPGLAVDSAGNVYISDSNNQRIRKVNPQGIITTVAGNGTGGYSGDGGPATSAMLFNPAGIAVDSAGNLYIADASNSRVRKVNLQGTISTVAGNGNVVYSGDGVAATATAVHEPGGVALDSAGNLYISETSDSRIRRVNTAGIISTIAGDTKKTNGFSGDGGPATAATLRGPRGLTVDSAGNLYFADNLNGRIRKVDAAGIITTFAGNGTNTFSGDGGPATAASIGVSTDVAIDPAGNVYFTASGGGAHRVRKVTIGAAGITAAPASLSFAYTIGAATPATQTLSVTATGTAAFTASASTTSGGPWLSVSPSTGTAPATLTVSVNPTGLAGGAYQGAITITPASGAAQSFAVTLNVAGAGAPAIKSATSIVNALGYQNKLAPDTVFVIFGSGMGPASIATAASPYPASVGGTSVTFTPAAGGTPVSAKMVYSLDGQIAGLLPSSIAPGTYAVRVTYNTLTSAPQNVTVVPRSFGIATANSAGTGTAQATIGNVNNGVSLVRFTTGAVSFSGLDWTLTPAHPGDTLVLWGTGGGADTANDTGGTSGDQTAAGGFVVTVGDRTVTPLYAGASSGYPGLWQVNFTLPADITPDCFTSLTVTAGGEVSNSVTIPIAAPGQSACANALLSTAALATLDAGGTVTLAGLAVAKETATAFSAPSPGATPTATTVAQEIISASFPAFNAAGFAAIYGLPKIGACTINDNTSTAANRPGAPVRFLDAGTVSASGPKLAANAVLAASAGPVYSLVVPNGTLAGGKYTISGNGGKDVAQFSASVNFPSSFTVTNFDSLTTIDRTKPLTINWTGGDDQVEILIATSKLLGKDASNANVIHTVALTCQVSASAGTYTVPVAALAKLLPEGIDNASLATGSGSIAVGAANFTPFNAPLTKGGQVDYGAISGVLTVSKNLIVQ